IGQVTDLIRIPRLSWRSERALLPLLAEHADDRLHEMRSPADLISEVRERGMRIETLRLRSHSVSPSVLPVLAPLTGHSDPEMCSEGHPLPTGRPAIQHLLQVDDVSRHRTAVPLVGRVGSTNHALEPRRRRSPRDREARALDASELGE